MYTSQDLMWCEEHEGIIDVRVRLGIGPSVSVVKLSLAAAEDLAERLQRTAEHARFRAAQRAGS